MIPNLPQVPQSNNYLKKVNPQTTPTTKAPKRYELEVEEETFPERSMQLLPLLNPVPTPKEECHAHIQQECRRLALEAEIVPLLSPQKPRQLQESTREVLPSLPSLFFNRSQTRALFLITILGMARAQGQDDCATLNDWQPDHANRSGCCSQSGITCNEDGRVTKMYEIISR
jgi:hypothetical protein